MKSLLCKFPNQKLIRYSKEENRMYLLIKHVLRRKNITKHTLHITQKHCCQKKRYFRIEKQIAQHFV